MSLGSPKPKFWKAQRAQVSGPAMAWLQKLKLADAIGLKYSGLWMEVVFVKFRGFSSAQVHQRNLELAWGSGSGFSHVLGLSRISAYPYLTLLCPSHGTVVSV